VLCRFRFGSIGGDCLDGIDGNDWRREQFASARDVLRACAAGKEAIVADAVKPAGSTCMRKRRINSWVGSVITYLTVSPAIYALRNLRPVLGAADGERRNCPGVRGVLSEVPEASMSAAA
jgi:hypothetical protein